MHQIPLPRRRMTHGVMTPSVAIAALALALFLSMATAAVGQEQLPKLLPIIPVPDIELVKFDATGVLDEIRDDAVIIDDTYFPLSTSEELRFFAEGSSFPVEKSIFKVGDPVGCVYDDFSKVKEIWKLNALPDKVR